MIKSFTQLYNFDTNVKKIDLGGVEIRRITRQEKKLLKDSLGGELTKTYSIQIDSFNYGIFYERKFDDKQESKIIEQVYFALRLYKNGIFDYSGVITVLPSGSRGSFGQYKFGRIGSGYFLNKFDKLKFVELYSKIKTLKLNLNQPIFYRFNRVIQNAWPEESILDYIIVIESLFNDGTHQEIRYKLSTRAAYILSQFFKDTRLDIFNNLQKSYSIRSKIMHTGKTICNHDELMKYRESLEDYTRKLVLLYVFNENVFHHATKLCLNIDKAINSNSPLDFLKLNM